MLQQQWQGSPISNFDKKQKRTSHLLSEKQKSKPLSAGNSHDSMAVGEERHFGYLKNPGLHNPVGWKEVKAK